MQGDTTTAFCGALAGFYADVPVGHVEAGLRTLDPRLAVPRGGQPAARRPCSPRWHWAPTPRNAEALLREGSTASRDLDHRQHRDRRAADGRRRAARRPSRRSRCRPSARRGASCVDHAPPREPGRRAARAVPDARRRRRPRRRRGRLPRPPAARPCASRVRRAGRRGARAPRSSRSTTTASSTLLKSSDLVVTDSRRAPGGGAGLRHPGARDARHDRALRGARGRRRAPRRDRRGCDAPRTSSSCSTTPTPTRRWRTPPTRTATAAASARVVGALEERRRPRHRWYEQGPRLSVAATRQRSPWWVPVAVIATIVALVLLPVPLASSCTEPAGIRPLALPPAAATARIPAAATMPKEASSRVRTLSSTTTPASGVGSASSTRR